MASISDSWFGRVGTWAFPDFDLQTDTPPSNKRKYFDHLALTATTTYEYYQKKAMETVPMQYIAARCFVSAKNAFAEHGPMIANVGFFSLCALRTYELFSPDKNEAAEQPWTDSIPALWQVFLGVVACHVVSRDWLAHHDIAIFGKSRAEIMRLALDAIGKYDCDSLCQIDLSAVSKRVGNTPIIPFIRIRIADALRQTSFKTPPIFQIDKGDKSKPLGWIVATLPFTKCRFVEEGGFKHAILNADTVFVSNRQHLDALNIFYNANFRLSNFFPAELELYRFAMAKEKEIIDLEAPQALCFRSIVPYSHSDYNAIEKYTADQFDKVPMIPFSSKTPYNCCSGRPAPADRELVNAAEGFAQKIVKGDLRQALQYEQRGNATVRVDTPSLINFFTQYPSKKIVIIVDLRCVDRLGKHLRNSKFSLHQVVDKSDPRA